MSIRLIVSYHKASKFWKKVQRAWIWRWPFAQGNRQITQVRRVRQGSRWPLRAIRHYSWWAPFALSPWWSRLPLSEPSAICRQCSLDGTDFYEIFLGRRTWSLSLRLRQSIQPVWDRIIRSRGLSIARRICFGYRSLSNHPGALF